MGDVRVAIVTESFLPNVNGVTNSVLRVLEYARRHGHDCLVVAPSGNVGLWQGAADAVRAHLLVSGMATFFGGAESMLPERDHHLGFPVHRVTSVRVPVVSSLPVGAPSPSIYNSLREFAPDVVHLASPFVLGAAGAAAARVLDVPTVAVYQTDVAGFAGSYGIGVMADAAWAWTRALHMHCDRTLAPSTAAIDDLAAHGIPRLHRWGRGLDTARFSPPAQRAAPVVVTRRQAGRGIRRTLALKRQYPGADRPISPDEDLQLVVVGGGPDRAASRPPCRTRSSPANSGEQLGQAYHGRVLPPGEFGRSGAIQEAQASGVPIVGPDRGGPRDLVRAGINGYLLDPRTYAAEVSAAVDRVLADHERLAAGALETIAGRTWDAICGQLFDHYAAAGARSASRSGGRSGAGLGARQSEEPRPSREVA